MECAEGTLFDEELGKCNKAEEVDCVAPTTVAPPTENPPTDAPTTGNPGGITCPPEGIDYVPDPTDCHKYYICVNGNPISETCAEGLLFDPVESKA